MCTAAWERNAAVGSGKGTQSALRVVRTGQEVVSRWMGRHGQESSEAYLPMETQALSWPYLDLGSLHAGVPQEHSRSASLAISAQVCVREVAL
jgi:hypothetical protein